MKALLILLAVFLADVSYARDVHVRGYTRKDGTYVQPHHRSSPNGTKSDNYSAKGNANPYTGKEGTVDPGTKSVPTPPTAAELKKYDENTCTILAYDGRELIVLQCAEKAVPGRIFCFGGAPSLNSELRIVGYKVLWGKGKVCSFYRD